MLLLSASPESSASSSRRETSVFEPPQRVFRLADDRLIALGVAELDQSHLIVEILFDAAERRELLVERGALLHQPAGALGIVPEIGVFGLLVQLGQPGARLVDVKDASSAARATA